MRVSGWTVWALLALVPWMAGCGGRAEAPAPEAPAAVEAVPEAPAEDEHAHDDDHDHGDAEEAEEHDHGHGHHHVAPRGGTLVALGDHVAHFEVLLDAETGKFTFYGMDGHVETPVRLSIESFTIIVTLEGEEPFEMELAAIASELTGETVGNTSEFSATDARLIGQESFDVLIPSVEIRGVAFEGVDFPFPEGNE